MNVFFAILMILIASPVLALDEPMPELGVVFKNLVPVIEVLGGAEFDLDMELVDREADRKASNRRENIFEDHIISFKNEGFDRASQAFDVYSKYHSLLTEFKSEIVPTGVSSIESKCRKEIAKGLCSVIDQLHHYALAWALVGNKFLPSITICRPLSGGETKGLLALLAFALIVGSSQEDPPTPAVTPASPAGAAVPVKKSKNQKQRDKYREKIKAGKKASQLEDIELDPKKDEAKTEAKTELAPAASPKREESKSPKPVEVKSALVKPILKPVVPHEWMTSQDRMTIWTESFNSHDKEFWGAVMISSKSDVHGAYKDDTIKNYIKRLSESMSALGIRSAAKFKRDADRVIHTSHGVEDRSGINNIEHLKLVGIKYGFFSARWPQEEVWKDESSEKARQVYLGRLAGTAT